MFHIAFVRTMMMMVGDINFAETVRELNESGDLSQISLGFGFYIILIILVNLGLINLMVIDIISENYSTLAYFSILKATNCAKYIYYNTLLKFQ